MPKYRASVPAKIVMVSHEVAKRRRDALGDGGKPLGDEGGRLDDDAATDDGEP